MSRITGQFQKSTFKFNRTHRGPGPRTHDWDGLLNGDVNEVMSMGNASITTFKALLHRAAKQRHKKVRTQKEPDLELLLATASKEGSTLYFTTKEPNVYLADGERVLKVRVGHQVEIGGVNVEGYNGGLLTVTEAREDGFECETASDAPLADGKGGQCLRYGHLFIQGYVPDTGTVDVDEGVDEGPAAKANGEDEEEKPEPVTKRGRRK